ncbi:conserved hypothetical protein (plasmid) [Escherichia coli SE15]|nr:conserved hypothetical protein [Escherichia coli SE15]
MSKHLRPVVLTYHCQFLLHGLSDHVGRGDVFNPQRRINGFMFFSLSVLNLEDHLGLVISPQSPLSAGYITLRACRRSLPLRFSTVTPGGIVGFSSSTVITLLRPIVLTFPGLPAWTQAY